MVGVPIITVAAEVRICSNPQVAVTAGSFSTRYKLAPKASGR